MLRDIVLLPVAVNGVFKPASAMAACAVIRRYGGTQALCSNSTLPFPVIRSLCSDRLDTTIASRLLSRDFTRAEARDIHRVEQRQDVLACMRVVDSSATRDRMLRNAVGEARKLAAAHKDKDLTNVAMTAKLAVAVTWIGSEVLGDDRRAWETYLVLLGDFTGTVLEAARAAKNL